MLEKYEKIKFNNILTQQIGKFEKNIIKALKEFQKKKYTFKLSFKK